MVVAVANDERGVGGLRHGKVRQLRWQAASKCVSEIETGRNKERDRRTYFKSKSDVIHMRGRSVGSVLGAGASKGQTAHMRTDCQICEYMMFAGSL